MKQKKHPQYFSTEPKIVVIRIRLGQYNEGFLFMEEAFVVLCRKGENCGTSLMCVVFPKTQRGR